MAAPENGLVRLSQAESGLSDGCSPIRSRRWPGPASGRPSRAMGKERSRSACCIVTFIGNCSTAVPKAAFSISAAEPPTSRNSGRTSYPPTSCRFRASTSSPTRIGCPSAISCFAGVVMLDVLHHLERPIEFLQEASRVLRPGGRLAMIEPAMTTLARRFYDRFHEEPVDMQADPFAPVADQSRPGPVRRQPGDSQSAVRHRTGAPAPRTDHSVACMSARRLAQPVRLSHERRDSRIGR